MQDRMDVLTLIREHAAKHPRQPAYCGSDGHDLSYAELIQRADEVAASLRSRGCLPGDRCGLLMPEGSEFLVSAIAILAARLCVAPIGIFVPGDEIDFVIGAAQLQWCLRANHELVRFPFNTAIDDRDDHDYLTCDPAYIRFTSGSTGRRKGVLLGHSTILERLTAANSLLNINAEDKIWFNLPMADHFIVSTLLYLSRGATILSGSEPGHWASASQRATVIYGAPDFYRRLVDSNVAELGSVRLAISTTAPLSSLLSEEFAEKFTLPLNPALGMIELGLLTINFNREKAGSVGVMMPSYAAAILDEGSPVSIGQIGELHVNGPGLLDAYISPWRPREVLMGKYGFQTGDYARFDEEGYLYLLGRGKNRITVQGMQFFCEEIESILNDLPCVNESRVFVEAEVFCAEIVGSTVSTDWIPKALENRIDERKIPTKFRIVPSLLRTPNGKIARS
jgi:long-chain acyl-CoA synthetase